MPFLRFSRDKRGYESTYLCHTFRQGGGAPRLRVLYWFRTPPDVRVGRLALDPAAIRAIEENNPDLRFDWDKILKVKPPPPPAREGRDERRARRGEKRATGGGKSVDAPAPAPETPPAGADDAGAAAAPDEPGLPEELERAADAAWNDLGPVSNDGDAPAHVVLSLTDEEGLARLRARHAEIQARITDRFRDPVRLEDLRRQAALLDPDAWKTVDEARERLAALDDIAAALRKILGRRRRTRRGGGRRRSGASREGSPPAAGGESTPDAAPDAGPSSNGGARPDLDPTGE